MVIDKEVHDTAFLRAQGNRLTVGDRQQRLSKALAIRQVIALCQTLGLSAEEIAIIALMQKNSLHSPGSLKRTRGE